MIEAKDAEFYSEVQRSAEECYKHRAAFSGPELPEVFKVMEHTRTHTDLGIERYDVKPDIWRGSWRWKVSVRLQTRNHIKEEYVKRGIRDFFPMVFFVPKEKTFIDPRQ